MFHSSMYCIVVCSYRTKGPYQKHLWQSLWMAGIRHGAPFWKAELVLSLQENTAVCCSFCDCGAGQESSHQMNKLEQEHHKLVYLCRKTNKKKESQVFMLEVGFFWLCPGEKAIYHPDLGTDECQSQGKYSTTAQERLDVLWAFTPLPLAPCLPFSSLLLHDCSNSRARRKNHKKSNMRPLCNRFLGEAQSKGLARNLHPLHSWAESHFRKHSFSKLWVFVSVEYEEHSHPLTKISSCSEESYMTNACLLCLEAAWLQATSYEQRFIASRSK